MTFGFVLLTLNEIDGVSVLFKRIPVSGFNEFFAVDGGSTDETLEFFSENGVDVIGQSKKGRGEAFRIAFDKSSSDVLIFFSPDGNEDPNDILNIKKEFENDPSLDLVIASRMMKGAKNEEDDQVLRWRKWANNWFNFLANLFFNKNLLKQYITDSINGFRGIKRASFYRLHLDELGYTIEYQTTIRAFKERLKIKEIPTVEGQRLGGESYAKSIPTGIKFLRSLFRELRLGKSYV